MQKFKRITYVVVAIFLACVGTLEGILVYKVHALAPTATQVQSRRIIMSSSVVSAASQTYQVTFTPQQSYTLEGIVVEFCDSTSVPIVDDADCTGPAGFSVGGASPTVDTNTAPNNIGSGWTATGVQVSSIYRVIKLTNSTGTALTSGTPYTFSLTSVTNPSALGTFYARLVLYDSDTGDIASYTSASSGTTSALEYGGFALSTAHAISITAKVAETLTFCVSGAAPGPNCGQTGQAVTTPTLTLGEPPNNVLDPGAVSTAQAFTQLSTNAQGGAVIRMKNTAVSGGLNFGTNSIPPAGDAVATITAGTAAFGVRLVDGTGLSGTLDADANYDSATQYGMDATAGGDGTSVLTTFGDRILSSTGPLDDVANTLTFAATASSTTVAGTYTANIILVAAGTY